MKTEWVANSKEFLAKAGTHDEPSSLSTKDIIMNAIDSSAFMGTGASTTYAGYVNPTYWDRQLLTFLEANLVVAQMAKVYDTLLGQDGATLNVQIDVAPTAAAAVAESADVTISAITYSQVTFTPTEYAKGYAISDKEARRAFIDVMSNMTKKIGYALALERDTLAVSLLQTSAGNIINANSVVTSAIASSDTLTYNDVINGATKVRSGKMFPKRLIISETQLGALSKLPQFAYVNQSGTDETVHGGKIGRIYGLDVYWTTQIAPTANKSIALVLGVDAMGEPAFGICRKALPQIRTQRFEVQRATYIVGVEEYDIEMLRTAGVCGIRTYDG